MRRTITYSLLGKASNSDEYYTKIKSFTDSWLTRERESFFELAEIFNQDRLRRGALVQSAEKSAFDLLALGVMLRGNGAYSDQLPRWWLNLFYLMNSIQEKKPQYQSCIKVTRCLMNGTVQRRQILVDRSPDLQKFMKWLVMMGEKTKVERFLEWITCYQLIGKENYLITCCLQMADRFSITSGEVLGKYTEPVDNFLINEANLHPWRHDFYLRNSSRLEYHLGMLGNEILNREYRRNFVSCPKKVVLLPPCMRFKPESECKAIPTKLGDHCSACSPSCRIHQVTRLGEKEGFDVFMIPEELRVYHSESKKKGELGIVGVSCVLTNWAGGWDADSIGLPAQGLLLDFVGCKYHWDSKGFPTDINFRKLKEILG